VDKCRAGLGAAFGAALIIAWVLRKISGATWRQTLWPRREPADWEKAPPSCHRPDGTVRPQPRWKGYQMRKITVVIELGGKNATGFEVPEAVVTGLGAGRRPPVTVSIGDYQYRSSIASMGGRFMVPVSAEVRKATGVAAGDEVEVRLELDTQPREVTVPDDFASALDGEPEAKRRFESLSYSHKRQHVMAIDEAKTAETRKRRIDKAIAMLKNP
jgi:hypothetical protein